MRIVNWNWLWCCLLLLSFPFLGTARDYVSNNPSSKAPKKNNFRVNCTEARASTDININNVRARLMTGGDMWWDNVNQARYIVPNVDPASGEPEVSALFAGAIWLGAYDQGGNLVVAAQTYRSDGNDYWPGPLNPNTGIIQQNECALWDKHFTVYGSEIDALRADFLDPTNPGVQEQPAKSLLGWPGRGNPHFLSIHGFDIRDYNQDLAPFVDANSDGIYDPYEGDHPVIEVNAKDRFSEPCGVDYFSPVYADQMTWWVYNDNGNNHTQTNGLSMQMEIQALAFGYATTDAINNMTFYRYKLLNRNILALENTYFSLWSDPDLGCSQDDYIGCDTVTGMGYVYNRDLEDDNPCVTPGGSSAGYGTEIPALGVDYFRGPIDSAGNQIGLSSFQYYLNDPGPMGNPISVEHYYGYMSGFWKDGTPITGEGDGYNPNNPNAVATKYVFPAFPNNQNSGAWSMCSEGLPIGDRRFMHTSGPFVLKPGATNEMISGVVWVPDVHDQNCPSLKALVEADVLAQNLFDNCFKITDGPDAPNIEVVELDEELVLNLFYNPNQNNAELSYEETTADLSSFAPLDTTYNFQGYKIYQVVGPNVSVTELNDESRARLLFQTDLEDSITTIANWDRFIDENSGINVPVPTIQVEGENKGIQHTFQITEDAFAEGEKGLINHQPYYFCVVAYAHNEYLPYDPVTNLGQAKPYLQGRKNFKIYTAIPRINLSEYNGIEIQSAYGDGPLVTRLDGKGNGASNLLTIHNKMEVETAILNEDPVGAIVYEKGLSPIDIKVVDPLRVPAGTYRLHICDQKYDWVYDSASQTYQAQPAIATSMEDSVHWVLTDVNDASIIWASYQEMDVNYEQYIPDLGISIQVQQKDKPSVNGNVGFIGGVISYSDSATFGKWYQGVTDQEGVLNMLKTKATEDDHVFDPEASFSESEGGWYPFMLCDAQHRQGSYYLSLGNIGTSGSKFRNENSSIPAKVRDTLLAALNNVNVVLSPDPSEWSRCIVVETASRYYHSPNSAQTQLGISIPSGRVQMEWKGSTTGTNKPVYYSRNKDMSEDQSSVGMSWFPGYAYDVETGERLNIFFGENSVYNGVALPPSISPGANTGDDMIFNPTNVTESGDVIFDERANFFSNVQGGQHIIYVTNMPYDSCKGVLAQMDRVSPLPFLNLDPDNVLYQEMNITWASMAVPTTMTGTYGEIPPTKATVQLRVDRPFEIEEGTNTNAGYPMYEFELDGLAPTKEQTESVETALDLLRVVPNPYYAYSDYEVLELDNVVKIINLPAKADIRIYGIDGRFIREFRIAQDYRSPSRNGIARIGQGEEGAQADDQINTWVEWDLKNYAGVPVAGGVYLIHVKVDGVGSRVLKSFIINRAFDAQRL